MRTLNPKSPRLRTFEKIPAMEWKVNLGGQLIECSGNSHHSHRSDRMAFCLILPPISFLHLAWVSLQVSSWNSVKLLEAPEIALCVRQENSFPPFLHPFFFITPKHRILWKYHGQQTRGKITEMSVHLLFDLWWQQKHQRYQEDCSSRPPGNRKPALVVFSRKISNNRFQLFQALQTRCDLWKPFICYSKRSINVEHSSYLLNRERLLRGSCFNLKPHYIL